MYDELFEYIIENNMLNDDYKLKEIIKCPICKNDLYVLKKGLLYCKKCTTFTDYDPDKQIDNKKLKK